MQQISLESVAIKLARGWVASAAVALGLSSALCAACEDKGEVSAKAATAHVALLVETASRDVEEVRAGLPQGAKYLASLWVSAPAPVASAVPEVAAGTPPSPGSAAPAGSGTAPTAATSVPAVTSPSAAAAPPEPAFSASPAVAASAALAAVPAPGSPSGAASVAAAGSAAPPVMPAPASAASSAPDPGAVRAALHQARNKVQDLRIAKSTFFALADAQGIVLRNDQEQDRMVGKGLFPAFPALRQALAGTYVETTGSMPEAAGIGSRSDGQWVAAAPVKLSGQVKGLYVTGWSWSAYAKRLEHALRGDVLAQLKPGQNEPLVYVLILADKQVFGWEAPDVNLKAVAALDLGAKLVGEAPRSEILSLDGNRWGVAAKLAPVLGKGIAIAVLRMET